MRKQTYILLFLFFPLLSCNQIFDAITNSNNETELLLSKIFADGKLLNEYVYDENNNLILLKVFHEDSLTHMESYNYNAANQIENRFYNGFIETYSYNEEDLLIRFTKYYEKTNKTWELLILMEKKEGIFLINMINLVILLSEKNMTTLTTFWHQNIDSRLIIKKVPLL